MQLYIYSFISACITVILLFILITVISQAVKLAISNMEKETDILCNQFNEIVDYVHTYESKEAARAILLYLNAVDSRVNSLLIKANYSEVSKKRYSKSLKKLNTLKKHIDKTHEYIMTEKL